jgi:formylglycine-generating enzyme required for sulfatase activity
MMDKNIRRICAFSCLLTLFGAQGCQKTSSTQKSSPASVPSIGQTTPIERDGMMFIKGGTFLMGTNDGMNYEAPAHEVTVKSFWMDKSEITVAEFAKFIAVTGYKTEAEKFGWSGVFNLKTGEWEKVDGADWRHPDGPQSKAAPDEPVCQVSWNDAVEYAKWAGKRLPTEAEWEYAARGGLAGKEYAWGDDLRPNGKPVANWWQGRFPDNNTSEDGFLGRAPVRSFAPNGFGLYDVTGNVWEWCADWYAEDYYLKAARENPTGPGGGTERVIRGGSWMCAENFCNNYRVAARSHATPDSGLNNLGFRLVRDE